MDFKKIAITLIGIYTLTACTYMKDLSEKQEMARFKSFEKNVKELDIKKKQILLEIVF